MDGELIERARTGDADAFDELARARIDAVYRMALGILGRPADARDATQEALVMMWRGLPSLREPAKFDAWLRQITLNACRMALRKSRGVREISIESNPLANSVVDGAMVSASDFDRAFDRLPVDQRDLLIHHHLEGTSVADMARLMLIPEGTVKSRLYAARNALDRAIKAEIK